MDLEQFLIIEIGDRCNLVKQHAEKCPACERDKFPKRGRPLNDDEIIAIVSAAHHDYGFCGHVGFHYYNEPLLYLDRIETLIPRIRREVPESKFVLWTNGTLLPKQIDRLKIFDIAWLTNYDGGNYDRIFEAIPKTKIVRWELDQRMAPERRERLDPCRRIFSEFIIDYLGNVHICCVDYLCKVEIGNVVADGLDACISNFIRVRNSISGEQMTADAPEFCRRCKMRAGRVSCLDAVIAAKAKNHLADAKNHPRAAVVFTHCNIPEARLKDHFVWNNAIYRKYQVKVYVVSDREYDVPEYAECLIYPGEMKIFNLSKTSNYGIKTAITRGAETVIKTDADMVFSRDVFRELVTVMGGHAVIPFYKMADSYERRNEDFVMAPKATGTISMLAAGWQQCHFNELCEGYGCDDGILMKDIQRSGLEILRFRDFNLWHIAHQSGTIQREFHGRTDHWNRACGFNPENFAGNRDVPAFTGEWGTGR